jgi:transmembrane sensor
MSTMKTRREAEALSIGEQAAEWLLILETGGARDREAFAEWISRSPLHVDAFLRASAVDSLLTEADREHSIAIEPIPAEERVDVTALPNAAAPSAERPLAPRPAWRWAAAATFSMLAVATAFLAFRGDVPLPGKGRYATAVGEQRTVALEDGSVLYLNTSSAVRVSFSGRQRLIHLESGEATFKVSRDAARPFRVRSGRALIEALGTQFNVRRGEKESIVSVIEGAVQVSREPSPSAGRGTDALAGAAPVRLGAREEAVLTDDSPVAAPRPADLARVEAWRARRLLFQDGSLAEIAAEFNRYNLRPRIQVEGGHVGERRFAAAFDADDPESLLVVLEKDPTLRIERRADVIAIRAR